MTTTSSVFGEALQAFKQPQIDGYEVSRVLGDGGQARVYLARSEAGREVAIKRWLGAQVDLDDRERIRREADALAALAHPNLVELIELTSDEREAPCLVLEFVDGTSLAEVIRQAGRLEATRAAELGLALAEGLAHLHARGFVHRDVKPSNVIVRQRDSQPVLIDLGIVKLERVEAGLQTGTTGLVVGSVPYMAPEQLEGRGDVDGRADLYGLGALLFEGLTGFPPWTDQGPWVRRNRSPWDDPVHAEVHTRRADVPFELRRIVARCLRGEAEERYTSANAVGEDLAAFLAGRASAAPGEELSRAPAHRMLTLAYVRPPEPLDAVEAATEAAGYGTEVRRLIDASDGLELAANQGELCVSFAAPSAAVAFGLRLAKSAARPRVGIHFGEVLEDSAATDAGLRVRGRVVDLARRLAKIAAPRQTLMSAAVFNEARQHLRSVSDAAEEEEIAWRAYGAYAFADVGEEDSVELRVHEAGYPSTAPLTPPEDQEGVRRAVKAGSEITLGWRPAAGLGVPTRANWRLTKKLGEGGFGEVWLATHSSTHDQRAFKFCFQAERLRQLKREVILFTVLRDTLDKRWDISQILDWQFEQAPFFIESEYSPNGSFVDWAEAQGGLEEIPVEQRIELMAQVAAALGAAHSVGVLHKDVKPSNVLITSFGPAQTAQLADFGVGRFASRDRQQEAGAVSAQITRSSLTEMWHTGEEAFSQLYVAPELLEGDEASERSDIYALGVMLFQVVRGDFTRALGAGWERHVEHPLLREDIAACVDSDPTRRLTSATELADRLRTLDERWDALEAAEAERQRLALAEQRQELARQRQKSLALIVIAALFALAWFLSPATSPSRADLEQEIERLRQEADAQKERADRLARELETKRR